MVINIGRLSFGIRAYGRDKFRWFYHPVYNEKERFVFFVWIGHYFYCCLLNGPKRRLEQLMTLYKESRKSKRAACNFLKEYFMLLDTKPTVYFKIRKKYCNEIKEMQDRILNSKK